MYFLWKPNILYVIYELELYEETKKKENKTKQTNIFLKDEPFRLEVDKYQTFFPSN